MSLKGKTVLVTGGSRGIGAATVRALHRAGATVVFTYKSSERAARAIVAELGERAHALRADLRNASDALRLWDDALDASEGRIDVLVNNAGAFLASPLDDEHAWRDGWSATIALNLQSCADLSRLAVLHFQSKGGGAIVNVSSRAAHRGSDADHLAYAAAKAGVLGLTRGIARGFAKDGVLAYAVAPGWVATDIAAEHLDANAANFPLGEATPPEDVAETITFLASGRARHVTGATIDITGADYVR